LIVTEELLQSKIAELQEQVQTLTDENQRLRKERDWARTLITNGVPIATEAEEQAFIQEIQSAGPGGQLTALIAELEAEHG
jgi:regulator of replication initiation timing